jgi:NADH-quinone oxidoreductase subunit C
MLSSPPVSVDKLGETIAAVLGGKAKSVKIALGEVTVTVAAADYLAAATLLRDAAG